MSKQNQSTVEVRKQIVLEDDNEPSGPHVEHSGLEDHEAEDQEV